MSRKSRNSSINSEKYITESIKIEKLIPGGQALGTLENGKKIFLWNALPGEIITKVKVTKEKSSFVEGIAEEIAQKSEHRIKPKDECYLATSPWQIFTEDYEAKQKCEILHEILRQHNIELPEELQNFQLKSDGQFYHYRNKMEYALYYSYGDQKIHLAFRGRGSHRKVAIEQSSLERPEIWKKAQAIIDEMNRTGDEARRYSSLLLRCNQSGKVSGGLLEKGKSRPVFPALQDTLLGRSYSYSPNGFFQINLPVYEMVLKDIARLIKGESVLDLYSGVGTIGLSVARDRNLTLVECDKSAYREMEVNAADISTHPTVVCARSEDALNYIQSEQTVIVDPPRAGCMPEVIQKFLEVKPEAIIYLSCNPATQARDVKLLLEEYQIVGFQPYNFFPRTPHIENLIVLRRK